MDTAIHTAPPTNVEEFLAAFPTGSLFQGCYVVDRHPTIPNTVLLLAPKAVGEIRATWRKTMEAFEQIEVEGNNNFRALDRMESLLAWKRLSQHYAQVPEFQAGGAEAIEKEAHWTGETYEFSPGYAWAQYFGDGSSDYWDKDDTLRARAGRIFTFDH